MNPEPRQEAWLRGPIHGIPPHLMPVFHSFQMVREDLAQYTEGLTTEDVWRAPDRFHRSASICVTSPTASTGW